MITTILVWIFVRPFVRKGMAVRKRLANEQAVAKRQAQAAYRRASSIPKPAFTDAERAYMAAHVPKEHRY